MPKSTTYKPTETLAELQRDVNAVHEKLDRAEKLQNGYNRVYTREVESAMRREARSAHHAERAARLLAAGNKKGAARAERRARLDLESAQRIRAKAEKRLAERSRRVAQRSTGLRWALTAILAAAAAVAIGSTVMTPSLATGRLDEPKLADVEVGRPPEVEGDTVGPAIPAEEAANPQPEPAAQDVPNVPEVGRPPVGAGDTDALDGDTDAPDIPDAEDVPVEEAVEPRPEPSQEESTPPAAPADDSTSYVVHTVFIGNGAGAAPKVVGGTSYTIVPLDEEGSAVAGSTVATPAGEPAPIRPGRYRVTIDVSGYTNLTCVGTFTEDFTVEQGKRMIVTAYLKETAVDGSNSYGGQCLFVRNEVVE